MDAHEEYLRLLDSGVLFEHFPWVTGNWTKDGERFRFSRDHKCYKCGKVKQECKCLDEYLSRQCSITDAVIEDLKKKTEEGFKKYGVTLDRKDLSLRDWVQHAYEEVLDEAKYLKKIITLLDETTKAI